MIEHRVRCTDCGHVFFEGMGDPDRDWPACPNCGSTKRSKDVTVKATAAIATAGMGSPACCGASARRTEGCSWRS